MGIFQAAFLCRDELHTDPYLHDRLVEQIEWFKVELRSPASHHFEDVRFDNSRRRAICWFRADAVRMVRRAFVLRTIVQEYGIFISVLTSRDPGQIVYTDRHQIVARPKSVRSVTFR